MSCRSSVSECSLKRSSHRRCIFDVRTLGVPKLRTTLFENLKFAQNCLRDAGKRILVSRSGAHRCRGIKAAHGIFKGKGATFVDVRANRVIRRNHPPPPAVTALLQKGVCKRALCRRRRRRRFQWGQRKTRPLQSLWGRTVTTDP